MLLGLAMALAAAPASAGSVSVPAGFVSGAAHPSGAAHASGALYLPDAFFVHHQAVSVPGRGVHVNGVVFPFVPNQWVTVRVFLGRHQIKRERLRLKPSRSRRFGHFSLRVVSPGSGNVRIETTHQRNRVMQGFIVRRRYTALPRSAGFGSTGRFVQLIQQRLAALHFWIPQTGVYDSGTGLAIDAYHRLLGWGTSQVLDGPTISYLLNGWGKFHVRYPRQGRHAEGNLGKQLLALIAGSKVQYIFPISSGKPSTPTVLGNFHIYRRTPGYLPDGMYYSSFFIGGYAIHGFNPAPDYPASHGCMRLPIPDAIPAYNWLNFGDGVDVYY